MFSVAKNYKQWMILIILLGVFALFSQPTTHAQQSTFDCTTITDGIALP